MADETRREEHDRLQKRTDKLKREHADLALHRTPFDKTDHDAHTAKLVKHSDDLRKHRDRLASDE